jgi:HNH endonuclease
MCIYCNTKNYRKIYENHYGIIPTDELGRAFEIHHIDGNHSNNSPENLRAVSLREHYNIHRAQNDWYACWKISTRLNLTGDEISDLASNHNKSLIKNNTHHFLKKGKDSVRFDPTIYTFIHKDGRIENLTYYEMRTKHSLADSNLSVMISGKRTKQGNHVNSVKGWSVVR